MDKQTIANIIALVLAIAIGYLTSMKIHKNQEHDDVDADMKPKEWKDIKKDEDSDDKADK